MWYWCYWYGSPDSLAHTQQKPSTLIPYETPSAIAHSTLATLQAKLDAGKKLKPVEEEAIKGYACLEEELRKKPEERIPHRFVEDFESLLDLPDKIDYPDEDGSHEVESGRKSCLIVRSQKTIATAKEKRKLAKTRLRNRAIDASSHETRIKRCSRGIDMVATPTKDMRPMKRCKKVVEEPTTQSSLEYKRHQSLHADKNASFRENNKTRTKLWREVKNKDDTEGWSARSIIPNSMHETIVESQKKPPEVKVDMVSCCAMVKVEGCREKPQASKMHLKKKIVGCKRVCSCLDMGQVSLEGDTKRFPSSGRKGVKCSHSDLSDVVSKRKAKFETRQRKATLPSKCMVSPGKTKELTPCQGCGRLIRLLKPRESLIAHARNAT